MTGSPRSLCSQLFGPGLLHNYIKAWSSGQPQRTGYKYKAKHSSTARCPPRVAFLPSLPRQPAEGSATRPRVIRVTSCTNTCAGSSGFKRGRSIFIGAVIYCKGSLCCQVSLQLLLKGHSRLLFGLNQVDVMQMSVEVLHKYCF